MQDYEQLGAFYLGREFDVEEQKTRAAPMLLASKDLTTHAVVVGMTGSGKTGLCLTLLEEAAIDGVPAIAIDPKGDIANLLLTFPQLRPEDFKPWIEADAATRQGLTIDELAKKTADRWREGLAAWDQQPERIAKFQNAVDIAVYTPGGSAGLPLTVLRSFDPPDAATLADADGLRQRVASAVAGLLALLGIDADPLQSREHILLSQLLEKAWRDGRKVDLPGLIREIQQPPIDKVGFVDLESFYPAKERFALGMRLNNLLASPGFAAWTQGEPLDIQRLLYTAEGKPRISILSIAHLSDAERMFFVTILLNEVLAWTRRQQGASSLRALLYMDEVFGYFPPTANPPSKLPMLTLLKQARAFGLGVVLATQNPVDLDYKGLGNTGAWFLGRLQTERDKARILDGLEGASATTGATFDRAEMDRLLSGLGQRRFLLNNVHEDHPVVFETRWALSYLRGPLSREEIARLMAPRKGAMPAPAVIAMAASSTGARPVLPPGVAEGFLPRRAARARDQSLLYRPAVYAEAKVHYVLASQNVDAWETVSLVAECDGESAEIDWDAAEVSTDSGPELETQPEEGAQFATLPPALAQAKKYAGLGKALIDSLYRTRKLRLLQCESLKESSKAGESEGDFRVRLAQRAKEQRELLIEKLKQKYTPKLQTLENQELRARQKVEKEQSQATSQTWNTAISIGSSVLGALFGRKLKSASNVTRAVGSIRSAQRVSNERGDVARAEESLETLQKRRTDLDAEFQAEVARLQSESAVENLDLKPTDIQPRKSEIAPGKIMLVWTPWLVAADGTATQAW